jgi:tryptophanyl-tRNA synthetase
MRPTGPLHLGHLVGALQNWAALQDEYECYYVVVDWHALMSEYADTSGIARWSREMVADWIACGLDPQRSTLFVQSQVPEHAELHLIFSCVTPLGWLERCPTYKEQKKEIKGKDLETYAFLGYPTLQAADILLYKASVVPVGDDQLPHVELTREIARRFNSVFGEVFPEPQAKLTRTPRLLGLDRRKMSKSYGNYIALGDDAEAVAKKTMSMITDPKRIRFSDPGHPEECNVCAYYDVFAPETADEAHDDCRNSKWGCTDCKRKLGDILNRCLEPIRTRRAELLNDPAKLDALLEEGRRKASAVAVQTLKDVHAALKF